MDRIGSRDASLAVEGRDGAGHLRIAARDHRGAALGLLDWLEKEPVFASVAAVGHRVVHGMEHSEPERVTPGLLRELHRITRFDPEHLPREISLVEAFRQRHPRLPQVACFDTAFHRTLPGVAKVLALPRRLSAKGLRRYGFHGLSYSYLMEELRRIDPGAAKGRVILAHLGNGASLAAVRRGKGVDTSMGFTPAAGLVMGTRAGDLDPGIGYYLFRTEGMTPARFQRLVFHESGLLGVSGTSSDIRDLCARQAADPRAREAVELFCYQAMKWIGSFAAVLGGVDTLVFSGGIGENASSISRLGFAKVSHSSGSRSIGRRNARNSPLISKEKGRVRIRVIRTDEERMIARSVARLLRLARETAKDS